jgi:lipopolysaccharide biosynthesis glycosyltransferase
LFCPAATPAFLGWLKQHPQVQMRELLAKEVKGWNVKPDLLLQLLDEGHEEVIWIDTDILLTKDFRFLISDERANNLIVAQEYRWEPMQGSSTRTQGWKLPYGRELDSAVCSCFIRVTPSHRELLEAWRDCLREPVYLEAQASGNRPFYLLSDQDALTALLGSSRFADIKIDWLKRGLDIVHCFREDGFTVGERLVSIFRGLPVFVHAQGPKPWRNMHQEVYLELSPYSSVAQQYRQSLDEDSSWIDVKSGLGKILNMATFAHPSLRGLLIALQAQLKRIGIRSTLRYLQNILKARVKAS